MRTIGFIGELSGLLYCPRCRKVYYELEECLCDINVYSTPINKEVKNG